MNTGSGQVWGTFEVTVVNWVTKTIHRRTQREAFEKWETKISNCEVTSHAFCPLAKSLMESDRPKAPTTIHGPLVLKFLQLEKANVTADCLENQFTPHNLCDENHEWQVEVQVRALLEAMDDNQPKK
jgi:hypothetical protein